MVRVKICGIRSFEDASMAVEYGADALGFVFARSPRQIDPLLAREIIRGLPPFVMKVGVFVNEDIGFIHRVVEYCGLDAVQLHGDEPPEYCKGLPFQVIKAFRVKDESVLEDLQRYDVDAYLLDSYVRGKDGGTGKTFNWDIARRAAVKYKNIILAGGLKDTNVAEAINTVNPYAVDVSSGVEANGRKDRGKIVRFMNEVRRVSLATA